MIVPEATGGADLKIPMGTVLVDELAPSIEYEPETLEPPDPVILNFGGGG